MHAPPLGPLRNDARTYDRFSEPLKTPSPPRPSFAPLASLELPPAGAPENSLWRAALDRGHGSGSPGNLAMAWDDLARGRLRLCSERMGPERSYVLARLCPAPLSEASPGQSPCLEPFEAVLLARLLSGEPQKALAFELRVAASTVSAQLIRALVKLNLSGSPVPLPVVLAAQAWLLGPAVRDARSLPFEHDGSGYRVFSVPRPKTQRVPRLTRAEQEVARLLIEGHSRVEIAHRRGVSVNTVARQISAIFSSLEVTGRYALVHALVDHQCFD
jgi:DNA-binding NarL/FixJ family response regulator